METLFRTVLNMSGTGAIVICIVLLLRLVLKRAPKRYAYWLWIAAAFRLVCPVSWRSVFSVFSLVPAAGTTVPVVDVGAGTSEISYVAPAAALTQVPRPALTPGAALPAAAPAAAVASPAYSLFGLAGILWLAGIAVMLIWGAVSYIRLAKRLRTAVLLSDDVWQSDAVESPFLMGLFPPKIYIPFGLEDIRLEYVLAHERFHLAHRDDLVRLLAFLILSFHWFNPLVWLAFMLLGRDMEMRCDEAVLGRGAAERSPYSETLLSFAVVRRFPGPGPLAFGESGVKARIKNALRWKKPKLWVTVLAALLCVAAVAACAANPDKTDQEDAPTGTPWNWTHSVRVSDIRSAETGGIALNDGQIESLVRLLNDVKLSEVVQGRGIPSENVLDIAAGIGYRLRWGGGIIELDFLDNTAAEELYSPGVWELHNGALYDYLSALVPSTDATVSGPGAYTGVEGYLRSEILREYEMNGITMFRTDGSAVQAAVEQTEITELTRTGALDGLALEGTLESWLCRVRLVLAEDTPELVPVNHLTEEDGRYILTWTHDLVSLRYPNGRADVLYFQPVNDNMTFYGYHNSYEEAIYDWYISACRLDLPPYVTDWGTKLSADGNYPAHRYDGDGWYLYIPISGWTLTEASEARTVWTSAYGTGSTLVVRKSSAEEASAERPQLIDGQAERFVSTGNGDCWLIFTQYDPKIEIHSSWVGKEPEILQYMTESFYADPVTDTSAGDGAYLAASGSQSVPLTPLSDGDHLADITEDLVWLPIVYDGYGPFQILHSGARLICGYEVYDAETLEALSFVHPSGLLPQTYVFQNAVPGRRYLVTVDTFTGDSRYVFGAYYLAERGKPVSVETLRALQQDDLNTYYKLIQGWLDETGMLGEQFESQAGEAGNWRDIPGMFSDRWCSKFQNASPNSPFCIADAGVQRLCSYLNAVSLTGTPRRLAFDVTLALGSAHPESFQYASSGSIVESEEGLFEVGAEAVLRSDDGIRWTVEGMNSGGSAGWGWRTLEASEQTVACIRLALEQQDPTMLLRYLPNLNWNDLSAKETQIAMDLLESAAVSDEPDYYDGQDQLIRDLYMLWGLKGADGAYAELFLDGPDSILARQRCADPEAFKAALYEMDQATQELVLRGLQF